MKQAHTDGEQPCNVMDQTQNRQSREDQLAEKIAALLQNNHFVCSRAHEGAISLIARHDGLLRINRKQLLEINKQGVLTIAAMRHNSAVRRGDRLVKIRVIPEENPGKAIYNAKQIMGRERLLELLPYIRKTAVVIMAGYQCETCSAREILPFVIADKLETCGIKTVEMVTCENNRDALDAAIAQAREIGADLIVCGGDKLVSARDDMQDAIRMSNARLTACGAPVTPDVRFLLGYYEDGTAIIGIPSCVAYNDVTVFDLILPRIAAGVEISMEDIAELGDGGLCLSTNRCL